MALYPISISHRLYDFQTVIGYVILYSVVLVICIGTQTDDVSVGGKKPALSLCLSLFLGLSVSRSLGLSLSLDLSLSAGYILRKNICM